ncbi:hypothetical protein O3G_MSEX009772 [Manduca sexta]|uniref:Uncharacterized protein n=1 Tax=Manduca sexta TaxID=7130 RepID=A0A921ZEI8_MANSE|nr:hypothetical protein O3G_MSEX009772 [Manduca sexta]
MSKFVFLVVAALVILGNQAEAGNEQENGESSVKYGFAVGGPPPLQRITLPNGKVVYASIPEGDVPVKE